MSLPLQCRFADRNVEMIEEECARLRIPSLAVRSMLHAMGHREGLIDGRPIIHLRVDHLLAELPSEEQRLARKHFRVAGSTPSKGHEWRPTLTAPWTWVHRVTMDGQPIEWTAYAFARAVHAESAIAATLWGVAKVPGDMWQAMGLPTAFAFEEEAHAERGQLLQFLRMLQVDSDGKALEWLRAGDLKSLCETVGPKYGRRKLLDSTLREQRALLEV